MNWWWLLICMPYSYQIFAFNTLWITLVVILLLYRCSVKHKLSWWWWTADWNTRQNNSCQEGGTEEIGAGHGGYGGRDKRWRGRGTTFSVLVDTPFSMQMIERHGCTKTTRWSWSISKGGTCSGTAPTDGRVNDGQLSLIQYTHWQRERRSLWHSKVRWTGCSGQQKRENPGYYRRPGGWHTYRQHSR